MNVNRSRVVKLGAAFTALTVGMVLSGCATGGGSGSETAAPVTEGVPYGATIEEYQAAFKDVDPVTFKFQATGPEGSLANAGIEAYAAAITEWSGGKITFEWGYSNGFVPAATEWAAGIGDGRIDLGLFLPYYTPDVFPKLNDLTSMTFLDGNAPTSTLVSAAWVTNAVYAVPEYQEEAEKEGIHVLASGPSVSIAGIFCAEDRTSLKDFSGQLISASGTGRVAELTALGFAPQSIAFTELYTALERGVVQCGSTVPTALESIGATALVPYAVADSVASLAGFPNFVAINNDEWTALPVVAQQLLTDRLDAWFQDEPAAQGERVKAWLDGAIAAGGGIQDLAPDARKALLAANDTLLEALAAKGVDVDSLQAIFDKWQGTINDDLYKGLNDASLEDFLVDDGYSSLDYGPYVQAMFDDFILATRPG